MVGKKVACSSCSRVMRSDNLKRYENICRQAKSYSSMPECNQKSSVGSGSGKWSKNVLTAHVKTSNDEKKNPRILELVDEIVNNGVTFSKPSLEDSAETDEPAAKKLKSINKSDGENVDDYTDESSDFR